MADRIPNPPDRRALPAPSTVTAPADSLDSTGTSAAHDLQAMSRDDLFAVAESLGLEPLRYPTPQHVQAAIHERRQLIASLDREALIEVLQWARLRMPAGASKEQLASEIQQIRTMRFGGLSREGLFSLARLRGADARPSDDIPSLVRKLKRREGIFAKLNRKRRRFLGSLVSGIIGEDDSAPGYQPLPPQPPPEPGPASAAPRRPATIKEEIEEAGFFGGIAGRIRKSADSYVNQKLDEIEARIDRKLDEIDRRLTEWRDREIQNRLRILKITLWATVLVAIVSLLYTYVVYLIHWVSGG